MLCWSGANLATASQLHSRLSSPTFLTQCFTIVGIWPNQLGHAACKSLRSTITWPRQPNYTVDLMIISSCRHLATPTWLHSSTQLLRSSRCFVAFGVGRQDATLLVGDKHHLYNSLRKTSQKSHHVCKWFRNGMPYHFQYEHETVIKRLRNGMIRTVE